jgi:hypothetical protein
MKPLLIALGLLLLYEWRKGKQPALDPRLAANDIGTSNSAGLGANPVGAGPGFGGSYTIGQAGDPSTVATNYYGADGHWHTANGDVIPGY